MLPDAVMVSVVTEAGGVGEAGVACVEAGGWPRAPARHSLEGLESEQCEPRSELSQPHLQAKELESWDLSGLGQLPTEGGSSLYIHDSLEV